MESHASAGTIQVTERTYGRLRDRFVLEQRAGVAVKGKGEMTTYILIRERPQHTRAPDSPHAKASAVPPPDRRQKALSLVASFETCRGRSLCAPPP
jgi:hypothetical protein